MQRFRPVELAAGPFRLRLARDADVDAALEMSRDPAIAQWYSTGVVDRRSARRWLRNGADWSGGTHATWVVADATDRLVGNFSMVSIDLEDLSAQMSYRTAPWARGRHVATYALGAATRWAFDTLHLERLALPHAVANPASCRVANNVGYLLATVEPGGYRDELGRQWDTHLHTRTRSKGRDQRPFAAAPAPA